MSRSFRFAYQSELDELCLKQTSIDSGIKNKRIWSYNSIRLNIKKLILHVILSKKGRAELDIL